jgi:uncharacterized protein (DUF1697 family)
VTSATRQVGFLRGINVGGHNRIAMADLRALVTDLGYTDVTTHLQSGNVLYTAKASPVKAAEAMSAAIEATLGLRIAVVCRTRDELAATVANDPMGSRAHDPARYLIVFLDKAPTAEALERLAAVDAGSDVLTLVGRDLYVWMPDSIHKSKISAALARNVLKVTWTGRNWNTVTKVAELLTA